MLFLIVCDTQKSSVLELLRVHATLIEIVPDRDWVRPIHFEENSLETRRNSARHLTKQSGLPVDSLEAAGSIAGVLDPSTSTGFLRAKQCVFFAYVCCENTAQTSLQKNCVSRLVPDPRHWERVMISSLNARISRGALDNTQADSAKRIIKKLEREDGDLRSLAS